MSKANSLSETEKNKVWLLTGTTGMDSSIFADLLLGLGYTNIHGIIRRSATFNTQNIDHIFDKLKLYHGDLTDAMNIHTIIAKVTPDYIVNFGAMSHVKVSAELENYTLQVNTLGVLNILQSVRSLGLEKTCKIYQANTSECYGNQTDGITKLNEDSPRQPVSIYGISKNAAHDICDMYRKAYGMFIVSSTLFNHEHERRGGTFVTQKIANYVAKYNKNKGIKPLQIGNMASLRDWSYASDVLEGVYLMLQQEKPEDFVLASGECHSVREFIELALKEIDVNITWEGTGVNEVGKDSITGQTIIEVNPKYFRDLELHALIGDASKAKRLLGWEPKTTFREIVHKMVCAAISRTV